MRAVNLLPKDAERARRTTPDPALLVGVAGLAIVLASLFFMFLSASQKVQDRQDQYAQAQQSYQQLIQHNPPPKTLAIQAKLAPQESERISAVSSALSYRLPWSNILGQIALVMPPGVKLTALTATTPVSANTQFSPAGGASAKANLSITGWAFSQESAFLLVTRLKILPALTNVTLDSSTINAAVLPITWNFSISAQIKAPGAGATP